MFLRCKKRRKDGKEHHYWSIVENRRVMGGRGLQRHVLYLGELNGSQEASWRRTVELSGQDPSAPQQASLFPETHLPEPHDSPIPNIGIRISQMRLEHPPQWGTCWLGCELWQQLCLNKFWLDQLPPERQGARWDQILQTLVLYRLIDPGVLEKFAAVQMLDVHLPTNEGREVVLTRYTQPEKDLLLLLDQLKLKLPDQASPKIQAPPPPSK